MRPSAEEQKLKRSGAGGNVAAVGGGFSLAALINTIPDDSNWKHLAIFALPFSSIVIKIITDFLLDRIDEIFTDLIYNHHMNAVEKLAAKLTSDDNSQEGDLQRLEKMKIEIIGMKMEKHLRRAESAIKQ